MNAKALLSVAIVAALAAPAFAQTSTPRVDQREVNQQNRINQGVASGQLTPKETAKLEAGQAKVDAKEAAAKSDGVVTAKEKARLARAQNRQSRKIYRQKHDAQTAAGVKPAAPAPSAVAK